MCVCVCFFLFVFFWMFYVLIISAEATVTGITCETERPEICTIRVHTVTELLEPHRNFEPMLNSVLCTVAHSGYELILT